MIKKINVLLPEFGEFGRPFNNSHVLLVLITFQVENDYEFVEESTLSSYYIADNLESVTLGKLTIRPQDGAIGKEMYFATAVDFTDLNPQQFDETMFYVEAEDDINIRKAESKYTWPGGFIP